jgi:uncharacterized circularly permuted ATP-grasp superfamily protein
MSFTAIVPSIGYALVEQNDIIVCQYSVDLRTVRNANKFKKRLKDFFNGF